MFDWDRNNLRKIDAHGVSRAEAEQALLNESILAYTRVVKNERRFTYYGRTSLGRFLAVVAIEKSDKIRIVTAYDLDRRQLHDYLRWRVEGGQE